MEINRDSQLRGVAVRNSNIPEELGRVEYLMSDKTGTLTKNKMTLKEIISIKEIFNSKDKEKILRSVEQCF